MPDLRQAVPVHPIYEEVRYFFVPDSSLGAETPGKDEKEGRMNSPWKSQIHKESELLKRNKELEKALGETILAAAMLMELISSRLPELIKEIPHEYDGFGKKALAVLRKNQ